MNTKNLHNNLIYSWLFKKIKLYTFFEFVIKKIGDFLVKKLEILVKLTLE
jgi:hypothetical protein